MEKFYEEKVRDIIIPDDLDPRKILRILSQIDRVFNHARFDYAYAKRRFKRADAALGRATKTTRFLFKKGQGYSKEDLDALVILHLENTPLPGFTEPIYKEIDKWRGRMIFLDAVIDQLNRKSGKLINGNGALKLDAQGRGDRDER